MPLDSKTRRRWIGGIALAVAAGMLVAGETVFKGRLGPAGFLLFWMVCFLLTLAAMVIAFLDARSLQAETRREHRDLLESTIQEIETEAKAKKQKRDGNGQSSKGKP